MRCMVEVGIQLLHGMHTLHVCTVWSIAVMNFSHLSFHNAGSFITREANLYPYKWRICNYTIISACKCLCSLCFFNVNIQWVRSEGFPGIYQDAGNYYLWAKKNCGCHISHWLILCSQKVQSCAFSWHYVWSQGWTRLSIRLCFTLVELFEERPNDTFITYSGFLEVGSNLSVVHLGNVV